MRKAAGLAGNLLYSTVNQSPEFMVTLFVTHVRRILDHCSCVWSVGYLRDVNLFSSVCDETMDKRLMDCSIFHM